MASYSAFSRYYDLLTDNVDYEARAAYFDSLIREQNPTASLLLDLACGTGSLSLAMAKRGYDVTAVDASAEMLSAASAKAAEQDLDILFLQQRMERLDLYGTMDAVVCALDSLNHVPPRQLRRVFDRLRLFTAPGGVFLFDLNTRYKHREVLAGNSFVYEREQVFCVWQNAPLADDAVEITLDFFEPEGDVYRRSRESFREYVHADEALRAMLSGAGFRVLAAYEADTRNPPSPESERVVYLTQRKESI